MTGTRSPDDRSSSHTGPLDHILAHDISNYLSIILGQTDLLLTDVDDPDVADRLMAIKRQATAATAMLQTVGGVARSRSQSGYATVAVGELVATEVDRLEAAYPKATLSTDIEPGVRARADELLSSVIGNLLENAIQHNDAPTPTVHVTAKTRDGSVRLTVEDDGPGLPDDVREQLLGRRLAHPQSGVHIVRFLVEQYGGEIAVQTGRDGTTITVELPGGRG